jgi:hypothetical protein
VAIGQLTMQGRSRLVGIQAIGRGLLLEILRRQGELRDEEDYFGKLGKAKVKMDDGVEMAKSLIESLSGSFDPEAFPDHYAEAVRTLVHAKIEHKAPEVAFESPRELPKVVNIMEALKKSMQKRRRQREEARGQGAQPVPLGLYRPPSGRQCNMSSVLGVPQRGPLLFSVVSTLDNFLATVAGNSQSRMVRLELLRL